MLGNITNHVQLHKNIYSTEPKHSLNESIRSFYERLQNFVTFHKKRINEKDLNQAQRFLFKVQLLSKDTIKYDSNKKATEILNGYEFLKQNLSESEFKNRLDELFRENFKKHIYSNATHRLSANNFNNILDGQAELEHKANTNKARFIINHFDCTIDGLALQMTVELENLKAQNPKLNIEEPLKHCDKLMKLSQEVFNPEPKLRFINKDDKPEQKEYAKKLNNFSKQRQEKISKSVEFLQNWAIVASIGSESVNSILDKFNYHLKLSRADITDHKSNRENKSYNNTQGVEQNLKITKPYINKQMNYYRKYSIMVPKELNDSVIKILQQHKANYPNSSINRNKIFFLEEKNIAPEDRDGSAFYDRGIDAIVIKADKKDLFSPSNSSIDSAKTVINSLLAILHEVEHSTQETTNNIDYSLAAMGSQQVFQGYGFGSSLLEVITEVRSKMIAHKSKLPITQIGYPSHYGTWSLILKNAALKELERIGIDIENQDIDIELMKKISQAKFTALSNALAKSSNINGPHGLFDYLTRESIIANHEISDRYPPNAQKIFNRYMSGNITIKHKGKEYIIDKFLRISPEDAEFLLDLNSNESSVTATKEQYGEGLANLVAEVQPSSTKILEWFIPGYDEGENQDRLSEYVTDYVSRQEQKQKRA